MIKFTRSPLNPILKPDRRHTWESTKVYNPGAFYENGTYHLFYRAVGKGEDWHSSIGYATSTDGENFERKTTPLLDRTLDTEKRGLEDPRITKIDDTYYLAYAAYDGLVPRVYLAKSKDLTIWGKHGPLFPDFPYFKLGGFRIKWTENGPQKYFTPEGKYERTKSPAMFPEKINGKYWMVFNEYKIWLAHSQDGITWEYENEPLLTARDENYFDSLFVEVGPPPIKTTKGWLVLYHGIDSMAVYRIGILLLDLHNPRKILYRSSEPVFWPQAEYELSGIVDILPKKHDGLLKMTENERKKLLDYYREKGIMPQVTFCNGAVLAGDTLRIYYGASDTYVCTASVSISQLLNSIK